jgi:hypothetical protein
MPDPATFAVIPLQHFGHRHDQFAVGEQGRPATTDPSLNHMIIDQHVRCGQEGVQFFAHTLILNALLPRLR